MFASMAIVSREGFEMVLIITLLLAATHQVKGANKWILLGGIAGVCISILLASLALSNAYIASLLKAKLTGAIILILASLLIAWTVIWMKSEGKKIGQKISNIDVSDAASPLLSLSIVAFLTVVREGSEVVLFLLGLMSQSGVSVHSIILGSVFGALEAIVIGVLMYFGLIRVNIGKVFDVFAVIMTFLSAGMAANAVAKLSSIGLVPSLIPQVWNTTPYFDHHTNWLALVMHVVFGYTEKPSLMQLIVYTSTLVVIFALSKRVNSKLNAAAHSS
ncbi:FTR1 family iron permease [Vibrio breoganii]|uniref:FTR1 family iron permease n=1 Tax=Vibrio breoganii TaxID=553239 RepID=UPI000C856105|nr:FTR1 family protein [Vibrio breoganii]PMG94283.1 iron permease [Vibrio breoganii]PMM41758.1 iron permease [Vibrio breoganii]